MPSKKDNILCIDLERLWLLNVSKFSDMLSQKLAHFEITKAEIKHAGPRRIYSTDARQRGHMEWVRGVQSVGSRQ